MSEELKIASALLIFFGIFFLILPGLIYLGNLLNKPATALISVIGNIVIKTLGTLPLLIIVAIILFIMAGIFWLGTFLKNKRDQVVYGTLVIFTWVEYGSMLLYMTMSTTPISFIVGFGFLTLIAPLFMFPIAKGLLHLLDDKIQQ